MASSAALAAGCATTNQSGGAKAKTYVLVHGGFHGGWCWRDVARRLRAEGHTVFTPTQTGMGEREHLLTPETGIATFVDDIVHVIECEELSDIILVGHSFGGLATSGAADRMSDRIRHAVYLDALVPEPGESVFGQFPKELVAERMKLTFEHRGVRCFRPFAPEAFGVTNPVDAAWLRRRLTPHPVKTYIDALEMKKPAAYGLKRTFIRCTEPLYAPLNASAERVRKMGNWAVKEIETAHDAMVTAPDALTHLLLNIG